MSNISYTELALIVPGRELEDKKKQIFKAAWGWNEVDHQLRLIEHFVAKPQMS